MESTKLHRSQGSAGHMCQALAPAVEGFLHQLARMRVAFSFI